MGKQVSRKTRIILIVCAAAFVAAAAAVLLGVLLTQLPKDSGNNPQVEYLPQSAKGELLVAEKVGSSRPNGDVLLIARSYDGNVWEAMPDQDNDPPQIDCNDQSQCTMKIDGEFKTYSVDVPQQLKELSPLHLASRLHLQATFGATKDELLRVSSTYGTDYSLWVLDQMRLTPTYSRTYYRQRANARPGHFQMGRTTKPCDIGSRWHNYVFEATDKYRNLQITLNAAASRFVIRVNNVVRGEVGNLFNKAYNVTTGYTFPLNLRICSVIEEVGGAMTLTLANQTVCNLPWKNPAIDFIPNSAIQTYGPNDALLDPVIGARPGSVILKNRVVSCTGASDGAGNYYIRQGNATYIFDARIKLMRNTMETPSNVEAAYTGQCPVVSKTYENRGQCVRRSACSGSTTFKSATFTLNDDILRGWYTNSTRYVYYVTDLRITDPYNVSPCTSGTSRWMRLGKGACPSPTTTLDATTKNTLVTALTNTNDANPYIRDISLTGANCSPVSATIGAQLDAAGECFQHVHPDLYSVRDFTRWVDIHDGNQEAMKNGNPNPISKWAEIYKQTNLPFPSTHPMSRFADRRGYIPLVGRYGDTINFQDLSTDLQTEEIATLVGALRPTAAGDSFVACGSYGEVENLADLGYHYNVWNFNATAYQTEYMEWPIPAKTDHYTVLENVALKATDQLRQRVAWSLLNIVTIASQDIDFQEYIEGWLSYYDMLVRNSFGSYIDIMRDVSYHPLMGQYLSYYQNKAFAVQSNYPDENYAREIMQLFSIGLWRLNDDGTQMLDQDGVPMETYTNDDIIDFARLWTGFDRQAIRDNFATIFAFGTSSNYVDKMQIRPQWRDRFPKAKLDAGYLGDTYPLCDDMPAQSFLREGARYEFTGSFSVEGDLIDQENVTNVGPRGRLQPSTDSALYKALCAPASSGGACTFPLAVTLTSNLPCTGVKECNAQRVIAVKIVDPVAKVTRYYQYIGLPCVRLSVFDQGRLVKRDGSRGQCADPATRVASPICCNAAGATASNYTSECMFANEVTDYATAQSRCESMGLRTCSPAAVRGTTWANACALYAYAWTNATCTVQVQVYSTGQVGIYDPAGSAYFNILKPSSNNLFRVRWDNNNAYPQADNVTCPAGCGFQATPDGAGSCLCNFTVSTGPVYGQLSDLNGINGDDAVNTIAQKAFIGSVKPSLYDTDTYTACGNSECTRLSNVVVWIHKDDNGGLSEKTIFQLPPVRLGGRDRYLFNKASTVVVSDSFSFRNPPHFTPLLGELTDVGADYLSDNLWVRKAEYEVESLLEHLFEHDNTAVFVSYRLIQQMVTSNPSPRYVKSVVNAFRTGTVGDIRFSGKYGDLGATVYAILMDHEARSPIVEADKTYGMLRDPLLKVYHFMRSLGYTSTKGREVAFTKMDQTIGVQPFTAPTVFGFYLPEYRPQGRVGDAGLVGPQVQIATTPALVGYLNGITSLIDNGLTSCDGGFAIPQTFGTRTCNALGPNPTSDGVVSYTPPDGVSVEEMVDELDMILLGGRLNPTTRATFIQEYNNVYRNASYAPQALRHLLKLFAISAEYQTTNLNALTATPRTESNAVKPQGRKFKAIVVVFEYGGCDSYSLIVPLANCPKKDMYNEYRTVRTDAALDAKALQPTAINVPAGTQPCNTFAVHPSMTNLYNLYQEGSALFTTNIGALVEPVTKDQVNRRTGRLPPSLFAHNIMQRNVQNVYAQYLAANGVLGRLTDALLENNPAYASALFSLSGNVKMVQGKLAADYLSGSTGVVRVRNLASIANALGNITEFVSDSVYADTYADTMRTSVGKTEVLGSLLANTNLTVTFGKSGLDLQMSQVAKLIKSMPDATGIERAVFFTSIGGFDTHATFDLSPLLGPVDTALGNFAAEMKAQGKWDDVVVLSVSDFARTLTSNGKGTDHAWGGNHFVAGGSIKGGQILGHYPEVLSDDGPQVLTRGRVIPTMPFEGMWKGIAEWFGVPADQMEKVLPNLKNFPDDVMYSKEQMFKKF